MLHKLENTYLAILRFVVLLIAGLLLISVAIFGVGALKILQSEPKLVDVAPKVMAADVLKQAIASNPDSDVGVASNLNNHASQQDPYAAYYERMVRSIQVFVAKADPGISLAPHDNLVHILKQKETLVKSPEWVAGYVKGLSETLATALTSPDAFQGAKKIGAVNVVDNIINKYTENFNKQINEKQNINAKKISDHEDEKADGMKNLYMAGGAFGAFLLLVFFSIIIRIERNLRYLERLPVGKDSAISAD